jgi:hypothetical protein
LIFLPRAVHAPRTHWRGACLAALVGACSPVLSSAGKFAVTPVAVAVESSTYAALAPFMTRQATPTSCSVASAQIVVNAPRAQQGQVPLLPATLLDADPSGAWRRATADAQGEGVSLAQLGVHMRQVLDATGGAEVTMKVVQAAADPLAARRQLMAALCRGVTPSSSTFVIANFVQSDLTAEGDPVGHFSPIGAYDIQRDAVLILDVDPEVSSPYWVLVSQLMGSMVKDRGYVVLSYVSG